MAGKYVLKSTTNGKFVFNLKAGNGEVILTSQTYADKSGAENGIASVRENSPNDGSYERKTSSSDQPFFVLKAANAAVIGTSEMYSSASSRDSGIESVKKNGPDSDVSDET